MLFVLDLLLQEQIQTFHDLAAQARKEVEAASTLYARDSYAIIAEHWEKLAADAQGIWRNPTNK
jgi:hypothetical protein